MIKILVTSIGSLVGQNILDSLETRRQFVTIVGLNSEARNQRMFRCDRAYLVPPTEDLAAFTNAFTDIIRAEKPDLILAGRDIDVVFLAKYKKEHPEFQGLIPVGDPWLASMMWDKFESCRYAKSQGLPFADTFLYRDVQDQEALGIFIETHGFPLVVKPRNGYASRQVFFLTKAFHVREWLKQKTEILFQEYLGDRNRIEGYSNQGNRGIPLFFQVPDNQHYAAQVVISPDGMPIRNIITKHNLVGGKAESLELFQNEEAEKLVMSFAGTLGIAGWSGFLNLQFKQDHLGSWKVYELNPRMVGASSARLLMGFDEIGMLMKAFLPNLHFPDLSLPVLKDGFILKTLTDQYLDHADVQKLSSEGAWEPPMIQDPFSGMHKDQDQC